MNNPGNLQIDKAVYPFINGVWVDENAEIKEGDYFFANQGIRKCVHVKQDTDYQEPYPYGEDNEKGERIYHSRHWRTKIIAQSSNPDLNLGVPYVEVEYSLLEQIDGVLRMLEDVSHGSEGRAITELRGKIQKAQSKGFYSEEQLFAAWNCGASQGSESKTYKEFLASLQPNLVVALEVKNTCKDCTRLKGQYLNPDCCEEHDHELTPVTEFRDGKTFYKLI
jgi:hypothetical protein